MQKSECIIVRITAKHLQSERDINRLFKYKILKSFRFIYLILSDTEYFSAKQKENAFRLTFNEKQNSVYSPVFINYEKNTLINVI